MKVLDFGLAKLTNPPEEVDAEAATKMIVKTTPGMVIGTLAYMSPEQARGLMVDARTDIWSFGVVLYEMLANHRPFAGETPTDLLISIAEREPTSLISLAPEYRTSWRGSSRKPLRRTGRSDIKPREMLAEAEAATPGFDDRREAGRDQQPVTRPGQCY